MRASSFLLNLHVDHLESISFLTTRQILSSEGETLDWHFPTDVARERAETTGWHVETDLTSFLCCCGIGLLQQTQAIA